MDIRTPIGLMFLCKGILIAGYGLVGHADYTKSLDVNINLMWGVVMIIFGAIMFGLGRRGGAAFAE